MTRGLTLDTERLRLRRWRTSDLEPFASLNADPIVMEHFPSVMTAQETALMIAWMEAEFEEQGVGLFVVEVK